MTPHVGPYRHKPCQWGTPFTHPCNVRAVTRRWSDTRAATIDLCAHHAERWDRITATVQHLQPVLDRLRDHPE